MSHHRRGKNPDANKLIIYHNPLGALTFDPALTTSVSTTVIWQTEAGITVTTGTNHALSYTPTAGAKVCKVTVLAGLRAVTALDCQSDVITSLKNLSKMVSCWNVNGNTNAFTSLEFPNSITRFNFSSNPNLRINLAQINRSTSYLQIGACPLVTGNLSDIPRNIVDWLVLNSDPLLTGALSDLPDGCQYVYLYNDILISPASVAHLIAIRDLRIYSMNWTAQANTDVLLSAWGARANYTYASGIALRIGAPTGTPGTEPPAAGESNADWAWNAGTSRHDPLTGYAVIADLQTDFYSEGFKPWVVTIV